MADHARRDNFQSPKSALNPVRATLRLAGAASLTLGDATPATEVKRRPRRTCSNFLFGRVATDCGRLAHGDPDFAGPMCWGQVPNHETGQQAAIS